MTPTATRILDLCRECAASVYDTRPPTPEYAERTARLLAGTAAQESGLRWERQRTPNWDGPVGGFSKWQLERGSITASLAMLRARPALAQRATQFLFNDPNADTDWLNLMPLDAILWAMRLDDNDKIGVPFCRLHYFRMSSPIPDAQADMAAYWKRWYNTPAGAGTAEQYLASWFKYFGPLTKLRNLDTP